MLISHLALQQPWPQMMKPLCGFHELLDFYVMDFQVLSAHSARLIEEACTRLASESARDISPKNVTILEATLRITRLAGWGVQPYVITDQLLPSPKIADSILLSAAFALVTHRDKLPARFWLDELDVQAHPRLGLTRIAALSETEPLKAFETFAMLKEPPERDFDIHTFKTLQSLLKMDSENIALAVVVLRKLGEPLFEYLKEIILQHFRDPRMLGAIERRTKVLLPQDSFEVINGKVEELCQSLLNQKEQTLQNLIENIIDHAFGRIAQRLHFCSPHRIRISPYETAEREYEKIYPKLFTSTRKRQPFLVITPPALLGKGRDVSTQVALTNSYTGFALVGRSNINLKPFELKGDLVKNFLALMDPIMRMRPEIAVVDSAARDFVNVLADLYSGLARRSRAPGPSIKQLYVLRSSGDAFVEELRSVGQDRAEFFVGPASSRLIANMLRFPTYVTYRQIQKMLERLLTERGHDWCKPIKERLEALKTYNCWNISIPQSEWIGSPEKRAMVFRLASVAHRVSDMIVHESQLILPRIAEDWNQQQNTSELFIDTAQLERLEEVFLDSYEFYTFEGLQAKVESSDEALRRKDSEIGSALSVFNNLFALKREFHDIRDQFCRSIRRATLTGSVKERSHQIAEGAEKHGTILNYFDACCLQKLALGMVQQNTTNLALN
jgi:hypothetical protein